MKIDDTDRKIGATVAFIRVRDCNQTQVKFWRRFGLTRNAGANIETGRVALPAILGWKICRTLDMHPAWLCAAGNSQIDNIFPSAPSTDPAKIAHVEKVILASKNGLLKNVWPLVGWLLIDGDETVLPKAKKISVRSKSAGRQNNASVASKGQATGA